MKALKKLSCVLLAVLLLMSLSVTAFAAGGAAAPTDGSITVENAIAGMKYTIYKILSFEPVGAGTAGVGEVKGLYYVESAWKDFFDNHPGYIEYDEKTLQVINTEGLTEEKVAEFAAAAFEYAEDHVDPAAEPVEAGGESVEFEGLAYGYYLVDSSTGALVSLDTAGPSATMKEKNEIPKINKEVYEDGTTSWGLMNHDDIGKVVYFHADINVEKGAEKYVMHDDMMDDVLAWTGAENVTVEFVDAEGNHTEDFPADKFSVRGATGDDGCTFEVVFDDAYMLANANKIVRVNYSATITEKAQINVPYTNDVKLEYGDGNFTKKVTTNTYVYGFDLYKYDNTHPDTPEALAGAKFVVYKQVDADTRVYLSYEEDGVTPKWSGPVGAVDKKYTVPAGFEFTTPASGELSFHGLDADTYYVEETEAPTGYNKSDEVYPVELKGDGTIVKVEVPNQSGLELPETGGIGTTIFYTVGGILVAAALVLLITKKRMTKEG